MCVLEVENSKIDSISSNNSIVFKLKTNTSTHCTAFLHYFNGLALFVFDRILRFEQLISFR